MAGIAADQVGSSAAGAPLAPLSEAVAAVTSVRVEELGVAGSPRGCSWSGGWKVPPLR